MGATSGAGGRSDHGGTGSRGLNAGTSHRVPEGSFQQPESMQSPGSRSIANCQIITSPSRNGAISSTSMIAGVSAPTEPAATLVPQPDAGPALTSNGMENGRIPNTSHFYLYNIYFARV